MIRKRNKLVYYRKRNILTQSDVAKLLGISQSYYGRLERNPDKIEIGMAKRLKKILKVESIDELFGEVI